MNCVAKWDSRSLWRPWLVNIDLKYVRLQYCNGYWYYGFQFGRFYKLWFRKPKGA